MRTVRRRLWLGAGSLVVGIGAALAGSGAAHADAGDDTSPHRGRTGHSAPAHVAGVTARARAATTTAPIHGTAVDVDTDTSGVDAGKDAPIAVPLNDPAPAAATVPRPASPAVTATYTVANPLPPRRQWYANSGYCGETSFISAGLYYGQYVSQYDARALASRNAPQNLARSQLLLGVNDVAAAKAMHLTAKPFNTAAQTSTASFLTWVKSKVAAGYPVAMGVYTNEFRFYGDADPNAGDPQYDHIVTVTGISSTQPFTGPAVYQADDVITFSDNGLWTGTPTGQPQYTFSYPFGSVALSRRQANAHRGPVYSLPSGGANYAIAITGVADLNHETVPVRLTTSVNAENPAMVEGSTARPAAKPVTLTLTVSNLTPGKTYNLYRYASMSSVPDSDFNANAGKAARKWTIVATGATYTMSQTIMSNEIAAYRAVPTTAR